jgi:gliding motility-associated lipoprotein GldH
METSPVENGGTTDHPILQEIKSLSLWLIFFVGALAGCNQPVLFEQEYNIADQSWHKDSLLVFSPVIEDTSDIVSIGFSLNYSNEYAYSNLWLFIDVESPGGEMQTDTMEYFLAEPDGEWIGKGNDRSRTLYWLYKGGVKMAQPGEYTITLQQGMRRDNLHGVQNMSLWIEKAEMSESEPE